MKIRWLKKKVGRAVGDEEDCGASGNTIRVWLDEGWIEVLSGGKNVPKAKKKPPEDKSVKSAPNKGMTTSSFAGE